MDTYYVGVLALHYNDQFRFINCNECKTVEMCTNHQMFAKSSCNAQGGKSVAVFYGRAASS